jgi:E3 ubiquitin-protein ligase RFWD2
MFDIPSLLKGGMDLATSGVALGEGTSVAGQVRSCATSRSVSDDALEGMEPHQKSSSGNVEASGNEDEPETSCPPAVPRAALTYSVRAQDLCCIICLEPYKDPFVTKCGHTFCYGCLQRQLEERNQCPKCRGWVIAEQAYPNKLVQEVRNRIIRTISCVVCMGLV